MGAGLVIAGALTFAPLLFGTRRRRPSVATVASAPPARSWTLEPGERVSPAIARVLDQLAADCPDVAIYVTDGERSYEDQAKAMLAKYNNGEDLHELYADDPQVDAILAEAPDIAAMAAVIQDYAGRKRALSRHLPKADPEAHGAADVRTHDLAPGQPEQLKAAAIRRGAEAYVESNHLHIEV